MSDRRLLFLFTVLFLFPPPSRQAATYVTLHCQGNGLYVSGRLNEWGQAAEVPLLSDFTMFFLRGYKDGTVSFTTKANRMMLASVPSYFGRIVLSYQNQLKPGDPLTKFKLIPYTDGTYAIKAAANGKYISCRNQAYLLFANRDKVEGPFERFYLDSVTALAEFVTARVPLKMRHIKHHTEKGAGRV